MYVQVQAEEGTYNLEYSRAQGQWNCTIAVRMSSVKQELSYLILVFPKVLEMPAFVEGIDLILSINVW